MARRSQPQTRARRGTPRDRRGRDRGGDRGGDVMSVLARSVREVEAALRGGRATPATRTKFQAVALLLRDERARVRAEESSSEARRAEQLKRLDGIATTLAMTAVRDPALLALLAEDAVVSDEARSLRGEVLRRAGIETEAAVPPPAEVPAAPSKPRGVPQSVVSR
ncbi:MAG: ATP-dependent helicase, partial [Pseudonocardia sp.]|nr:ATP-dependent helicase [Pseudonocardia sp.]